CFIFGDGLKDDKWLVENFGHSLSRLELKDLLPETWLHGYILTAVACKLAVDVRAWGKNGPWYLPSNFEDLVVKMGWTPKKAVENYKNLYLCGTFECTKIYLPMNDENRHWFLIVVF
ncbi:unnamed protein product, partial [Linum tenue]